MQDCVIPSLGNRRTFWATSFCAATKDPCGNECGVVGIELDCNNGNACSLNTDNWLVGLILNILMTDGRRDNRPCGWRPGTLGGHWSDSYRSDVGLNSNSGSLCRDLTSHGRISDAIRELTAYVRHDLNKLIDYGVAVAVDVSATYKGSSTAALNIVVTSLDGSTSNVGLSGKRSNNSWIWET